MTFYMVCTIFGCGAFHRFPVVYHLDYLLFFVENFSLKKHQITFAEHSVLTRAAILYPNRRVCESCVLSRQLWKNGWGTCSVTAAKAMSPGLCSHRASCALGDTQAKCGRPFAQLPSSITHWSYARSFEASLRFHL